MTKKRAARLLASKLPASKLPGALASMAKVRALMKGLPPLPWQEDIWVEAEGRVRPPTRAEAEAILKGFVEDYRAVARRAYEDGYITVWRAVTLPRLKDLDTANLGACWSYDIDGAESYAGYGGPAKRTVNVRVEARARPQDVDWDFSLMSTMVTPGEREIRLGDHAPVEITAIAVERRVRGRMVWREARFDGSDSAPLAGSTGHRG